MSAQGCRWGNELMGRIGYVELADAKYVPKALAVS